METKDPALLSNMLVPILSFTRAIGELDLSSIIDESLKLATNLTGADISTMYLFNDDKESPIFAGSFSTAPYSIKNFAIRESVSNLANWVRVNKESISIFNVRKLRKIPDDSELAGLSNWVPENIISILVIPIMSMNQAVGALIFESNREDNFTKERAVIIHILASILGPTLEKKDIDGLGDSTDRTKYIDKSKGLAFVLMPFREPFDKYYRTIFRPAIEAAGLFSLRVDEIFGPSSIGQDIWENISKAKVILAELSTRNPNVMYELGLSHGAGKPVVMISQSIDDIPFDLRHLRCILYDTTDPDWASELKSDIINSIGSILDNKIDSSPYKRLQDFEK